MPENDDQSSQDTSAEAGASTSAFDLNTSATPRQSRAHKRSRSPISNDESEGDDEDDFQSEEATGPTFQDPYPTLKRKQEIVDYWKNQTVQPRTLISMKNRFTKLTDIRMLNNIERAVLNGKFENIFWDYGFMQN